MTAKSKLIYKIITAITLFAPVALYLFLSATLFNIIPDYRIKNVEIAEVNTIVYEEYNFVYTTNAQAVYDGVVVQDSGYYGFYVDEDDILRVGNDYYNYELEDIKKLEVQKQTSYKLPMTFFISLIGIGIVVLVVNGKMDIYKKYPRISTLVALLTGTGVLFIINTIVGNLFNVFLIATASWAVYCLEYLVKNNAINKDKADKVENDLVSALKEAINNG